MKRGIIVSRVSDMQKKKGGGWSYQVNVNFFIFTQIINFTALSNIKRSLHFAHRLSGGGGVSSWEMYILQLFITLASFPNADPAPNFGWSSTWKVLNTF